MQSNRNIRATLLGVAVMTLAAVPSQAQLISTMGPYIWTNPCTGGQVRVTVRVSVHVPALGDRYRWDYEIYNISLTNPPNPRPNTHGVGEFQLRLNFGNARRIVESSDSQL